MSCGACYATVHTMYCTVLYHKTAVLYGTVPVGTPMSARVLDMIITLLLPKTLLVKLLLCSVFYCTDKKRGSPATVPRQTQGPVV